MILIRASPDREGPVCGSAKLMNQHESDRKANFNSECALHVINDASVRALKEVVRKRTPSSTNDFVYHIFRPNILIDVEPAYVEEEICLARASDIMLRQTGPCIRCK